MFRWLAVKKTEHPAISNKIACTKIFANLSRKDLSNCRLVCSLWNKVILRLDDYFPVVAIYDEEKLEERVKLKARESFRNPQKLVKQFLDQSTHLEGFSTLVVANGISITSNFLLAIESSFESLICKINSKEVLSQFKLFTQNVTSIRFGDCYFQSVASFLLFIGSFPKLTSITITKSVPCFECDYEVISSILDGSYVYKTGQSPIWRLTKLCVKQPDISPRLLFIFRYLLFQNCELEAFTLWLEGIRENFMTGGSLVSQLLTKSIHTFHTLKKIVLNLKYSKNGISLLPLIFDTNLSGGPTATPPPLEHLEINCDDLKEHAMFFNARLLPWIESCNNLKILRLSPLILNETFPLGAIERIMRKPCDIKFQVEIKYLASDLMRNILSSASMRKILQAIEFSQGVDNPEEGLLEYFQANEFTHVNSLSLQYIGRGFERRWSLPGNLLLKIFPNLTFLCIKGDKVHWSDDDLQLILQHLVTLQTFRISSDLSSLTDFGTTGRKEGCPDTEISFSNLKYLRVLNICKIGKLITNKTLKYGFSKLKNLTYVRMSGKPKITWGGKRRFKKEHKNASVDIYNNA